MDYINAARFWMAENHQWRLSLITPRRESSVVFYSQLACRMTGWFIEDFRHSVMAPLRKHRGFAIASILSLGLGIGLITTIFTFVNAIFLQALPVKDLPE